MKTILQRNKECVVCGTTYELEDHHVFFGFSNRKLSERYGLKVWLCANHHRGDQGVHFNKDLDLKLKMMAQEKFEETHTRDEFRQIFGKSYL